MVYNGLGDRIQLTTSGETEYFVPDIAIGLTQVLSDSDGNTYLYGIGRIGEYSASDGWAYHLGDALGSLRQLTDESGAVTLSKSYQPYGEVLSSVGDAASSYGFTGEFTDTYIKLIYLRSRYYSPASGRFTTRDTWQGDYNRPLSLNRWNYVESNPVNFTDPSGRICLDPWAPSGFHLDPNRGCDYPEGSEGRFWWRKDSLGDDTAIIDMPWVDEQSQEFWNQYPNSCGAAALYMFLEGEGIAVNFDVLIQQLRDERPGGYDGYCCSNGWGRFPTPTPDPKKWCNEACTSAETLADVARKYYGLNIASGDNWTREMVYKKVSDGHPVLTLIRAELGTRYPPDFGHYVVIKGFIDNGWTVIFNDSYPGRAYWDRSYEERRQAGEGRQSDWETFDDSWASAVDKNMDPLSVGGLVRWAMAIK
jgi:RHS repeat-associated protein